MDCSKQQAPPQVETNNCCCRYGIATWTVTTAGTSAVCIATPSLASSSTYNTTADCTTLAVTYIDAKLN